MKDFDEKEYFEKATALMNEGEYQSALEMYQVILEKNPEYCDALLNCGITEFYMQDYQAALKRLSLLVDKYPSDNAYYCRSNVHAAMQNFKEVLNDSEKALELYKKSPGGLALVANILNNLGLAYLELNDYEKSVKYLSQAHAEDSSSVIVLYNRAIAYRYLKEYIKAETDLLAALEIDPYNAGTYFEYGKLLCTTKEYQSAIGFLEKALICDPLNQKIIQLKVSCERELKKERETGSETESEPGADTEGENIH